MRRSGGVRGVVALILVVALGAGVFAGCGGEAEPSGAAPSALESRDAPRAVTAEEEPQQEEVKPTDAAATAPAVVGLQLQSVIGYDVPDGEGGIDLSLTRGVGSGPGLLRVSSHEYRCSISVRQFVSDETAGRFAVTFSEIAGSRRSGELARRTAWWSGEVQVTGPSWEAEYELPLVDSERIRSITVRVSSDASDAKWSVACRQVS